MKNVSLQSDFLRRTYVSRVYLDFSEVDKVVVAELLLVVAVRIEHTVHRVAFLVYCRVGEAVIVTVLIA